MPKRSTHATPNAEKPMKQLQARLEGKTVQVSVQLDEMHLGYLEAIQKFCRKGMHLDPSKSVVLARAIEVLFWALADRLIDVRVKEEKGDLDPDAYLLSMADALYEERTALLRAANRIDFTVSDAQFRKVEALIEKEKRHRG